MDDVAYNTMIWAAFAAAGVAAITAIFVWAPWARTKPRRPEEHPAE